MRIGASFPVGCCDKSCTLFRRLRRICASADIVCSGGRCDDLRTRDTDDRRSSNVRSLRIYLPSAELTMVAASFLWLYRYATGSDDSAQEVKMVSRLAQAEVSHAHRK